MLVYSSFFAACFSAWSIAALSVWGPAAAENCVKSDAMRIVEDTTYHP